MKMYVYTVSVANGCGSGKNLALTVRPCSRSDKLKNLSPLKFIENQYTISDINKVCSQSVIKSA